MSSKALSPASVLARPPRDSKGPAPRDVSAMPKARHRPGDPEGSIPRPADAPGQHWPGPSAVSGGRACGVRRSSPAVARIRVVGFSFTNRIPGVYESSPGGRRGRGVMAPGVTSRVKQFAHARAHALGRSRRPMSSSGACTHGQGAFA